MMNEFESSLGSVGGSLLKCAEIAQAMPANQKEQTAESAEELKKLMVDSVIKFMNLESDALNVVEVFKQLNAEVRDEDEVATMESLNKRWEEKSKAIGEVKGGHRKDFKRIAKEIQDYDGEEMEVMQVQYSRKDPIMKMDIVKPVKTKACPHVYDHDMLLDFMKNKPMIACAVQGCKANIIVSELEDFPEFFDLVKEK